MEYLGKDQTDTAGSLYVSEPVWFRKLELVALRELLTAVLLTVLTRHALTG